MPQSLPMVRQAQARLTQLEKPIFVSLHNSRSPHTLRASSHLMVCLLEPIGMNEVELKIKLNVDGHQRNI